MMNGLLRFIPLRPAAPQACRDCPWRFSNGAKPDHSRPGEIGADLASWANKSFLQDEVGLGGACHMTFDDVPDEPEFQRTPRSIGCAGYIASHQRALIRDLLDGDETMSAEKRAELLARFLKDPGDDREAAARRLLAKAHPAVFDPEVGCGCVPAPTEEELARWRALVAEAP